MSRMALVSGILFIALAVLVFADGFRRWYSGLFFALTGAIVLVSASRRGRAVSK